MSYVVLALKWRPQRFGDVTGQHHVSRTLSNALKTERTAHAYLFCGPRGVGKTSMARILAKAINCEHGPGEEPCNACDSCREVTTGRAIDVIEIDGASNRGIDDIRDLREGVRYAPAHLRAKVYIIDEVHMLTQDAFNALLKTLEEPPPRVVFVLATTEPLKVPQTILSRCQRFDFARLRTAEAAARLAWICEQEGIEAEAAGLSLVARKGDGSMRDSLTLLDQVLATGLRPITAQGVTEALGIAGRELYFEWTEAIIERASARALQSLGDAIEDGANLQELAEEFLVHLRNLLLVATDPGLVDLIEGTDEEKAQYVAQAERWAALDLLRAARLAMETVVAMRRSGVPRVHLELLLAELAELPSGLDLRRFLDATKGRIPDSPASRPQAVPSAPIVPRGASATEAPARAAAASSPRATSATTASTPESPPEPETSDDPWERAVADVSAKKPALAAFLIGSRLIAQEGTSLRVGIPGFSAFHLEQLDKGEHRRLILAAVEAQFGAGATVKYEAAAAGAAARSASRAAAPRREGGGESRPDATSPDQVRRIADLFDGDVIGPA